MDTMKILIAESDSAMVMELRKKLERIPHDFHGLVRTLPELLARVREQRPDVVLLNTSLLRAGESPQDHELIQEQVGTPLVWIGKPSSAVARSETALQRPMTYLRYPFDDAELLLAIRSVIRLRALESGAAAARSRLAVLGSLMGDCAYEISLGENGLVGLEWFSESLRSLTGFTDEALATPATWPGLVHKSDLPSVERYFQRVLRGIPEAMDFRLIRADGSTRWVHHVAHPLRRMPDGPPDRIVGLASDVTELTRLHADLREGEERWKFAVDASGEAVWDWNIETGDVYYSDRWKEMVGVRDDEVTADFDDWDRRIHPEDRKRVHEEIRRYFRGETPHFESEYRVRTADGVSMWVLDRGKIVRWTPDGKPGRLIGIRKDITRRRQIEEALGIASDFLRDILESASAISIISTDADGQILFWNAGAENLLGYPAAEMVGQKNIADLYAPDDPETLRSVEEMREQVRSGKRTVSRTLQEVHRDGRRLWVKVTVAPRLDTAGNVKGMLGIGEDVTGEIDALRQSERREREMRLLAFTLDCARDGFCVTDLQQTILHVNQSLCQMYGYQEEELVGRTIDLLRSPSVPPEQVREIALRTQHGGWSGELMQRRKNGEEFPADLSTSVVRNDDGEPVARVTVARDISERRKAEQQIRASLNEKEILLKEIHHRVKNNLQVITSLLNLQSSKEDHPQTAAVLRESQNRIRSMALVHEELYRSRDLARVDLSSYIGKLASGLFRVFASPSSEIGLQIEVRDVFLPVDTAIPCGLILNELISNALKHAFRSSPQGTITIRMAKRGEAYELLVQDDGVGLPPYLSLESAETLGLQLVNTLIKQLHGTLQVERTGGTAFLLRFPEPEKAPHG